MPQTPSWTLNAGVQMPVVPDEFFPNKEPDENANFVFDANKSVGSDSIVAASFATMPGGEIIPSRLSVTQNYVTVWLAGGVPGRDYIHSLTMTLTSGNVLAIYIGQVCYPISATPVPVPQNPGFGHPVFWPLQT